MKLYGAALSPYVMRPTLIARFKGHDIAIESFEGGIKSPEYLALNPVGKMPTFVDGDFALPESGVIAEYLDEALDGPKAFPVDVKERARVRLIARFVDCYIAPEIGALFNARTAPDAVQPAKDKMQAALGHIDHFRTDADRWLAGPEFTGADAALAPIAFFFDAMDGQTQSAAMIEAHPRIAAWWRFFKATPMGSRMVTEQAAGLKAMFASR